MIRHEKVAVLALCAAFCAPPALAAAPKPADPRLTEILAKFDAAQSTVKTLSAEFSEIREIGLLSEPVHSTGHFYFTQPGDVRWEYQAPKRRVFLIRDEELLAYFPDEKRAQKARIGLYQNRLMKMLGIGQVSADLKKYYDISLVGESQKEIALLLSPHARSVKSRLSEVRIWIDPVLWLPARMQYREDDGDTTTITFTRIEPNAVIADGTYRVELPADVKVEHGLSGFSPGKPSS